MNDRRIYLLTAFTIAQIPVVVAAADSDTYAALIVASVERIRTAEGRAVNALGSAEIPPDRSLIDLLDGSIVIVDEFAFIWDRDRNRTRLTGRRWTRDVDRGDPIGEWTNYDYSSHDGTFRTFVPDSNKGLFTPVGTRMVNHRQLEFLLGHKIISYPNRDVVDVLRSGPARSVGVSERYEVETGRVAVAVPYVERLPDQEIARVLVVEADPQKDFIPTRIIIRNAKTETRFAEIVITEHAKVAGAWCPVSGTFQMFGTKVEVPNGYEMDEVIAMSSAERDRINSGYVDAPYGKPSHIRIDPDTLIVNEPIEESELIVAFNPGGEVWDGFTGDSMRVDEDGELVALAEPGDEPESTLPAIEGVQNAPIEGRRPGRPPGLWVAFAAVVVAGLGWVGWKRL